MKQMSNQLNTETVFPGDPRVRVLLGKQTPPEQGQTIRPCHFTLHRYVDGRYLLFHTLTRRAVLLSPALIQYFVSDKSFSSKALADTTLAKLYEDFFLVPADCDEVSLYQDIKDILCLKEELPAGIGSYVILPTSVCNARCFYCFEQGMRYRKMSPETLEHTVRYILDHLPERRNIHVSWFGGEPLMAADNIDQISQCLKDAGVEFQSDMISNGSRFNDEIIERAVSLWNLGEVQITLDGLEEEYCRRKRYLPSVSNPFPTVIANVHRLLAKDITVKLRLNLDADNIGELFRCVDYIAEEFSEEAERKKLLVYSHALFGCAGCGIDHDVEPYVDQLNDYIGRKGLGGGAKTPELFQLKTTYCMADRAEHTAVIDAEGRLYTCEAMPENLLYGDVKNGITDMKKYERITTNGVIPVECRTCAYLPECTDFLLCPNREELPKCRKHMIFRTDRAIHGMCFAYQEHLRKQSEENEKPDV